MLFTAGDSELNTNAVLLHQSIEWRSPILIMFILFLTLFLFCRWVQIACPRLSIDWGTAFSKPLLSPYEVHASYIHSLFTIKAERRDLITPATWTSLGTASQNLFML